MRIKITADSTCDLPVELVEKYNIGIVPLYIVDKDKTYRDGIDITAQEIFDKVAAGGEICSTAAVNVADYIETFSALLKEYDAIIHINLSSQMSACHQNALLAAAEVGNVYPVDSKNLSSGSGLLVLLAAELAARGEEPEQIVRALEEKRELVDASFVLETLNYLSKGGRCSAVAAFGANLLNIKPCIEVREGKMGLGRKYRGSVEKALIAYVTDRLKGRTDIDYGRIFITHSGVSPQIVEKVRETVQSFGDFGEVIESRAGCTISNHCGPSTLGILYFHK